MDKMLELIHIILNDKGITTPDYRLKLIGKEIIPHSDWIYIEIDIYRPHKRKPCQYRKLAVNIVRNIIDFERSSFTNY